MSDLSVDFCGLLFKNPVIVSSIEPTNSLERLKKCIDAGAAGAIVKTLTDIPVMNTLTRNSKYAILNENGKIIKGKVPRNYVFYSRSGFAKEAYQDWGPHLKKAQIYADQSDAHIIASIGAGSLDSWVNISKMAEDCGIKLLELNLELYTSYGYEIVGILGMNPSPSCGVDFNKGKGTMLGISRDTSETAGPGVFIEEIKNLIEEEGFKGPPIFAVRRTLPGGAGLDEKIDVLKKKIKKTAMTG